MAADTTSTPRDYNFIPIIGTYRTITNLTRVTSTTPGTAVQITATATPCKAIVVQAIPANSGAYVAVGDSTTKATAGSEKGILISPASTLSLPINDVSSVWFDVRTSGDGVTVQYYI